MAVMLLAVGAQCFGQARPAENPYLQNAARILARDFRSSRTSYILMDLRTGAVIETGWRSPANPIPIGSLVKPFTAVAYAESHDYRYPEHTCAGGNACWNPRGHGKLNIARAVALSCNSYFTQLAEEVSAADVADVARRYGLAGPTVATSPEGLIGRYGEWRESPRAVVHAYAELLSRASQPGIREIVEGMKESAKSGTAEGASSPEHTIALLAKTGTAPCVHPRRAPNDGFALLAWPAETPHYLLIVRQHGAPGAQAAVLAGRMLRSLEPRQ